LIDGLLVNVIDMTLAIIAGQEPVAHLALTLVADDHGLPHTLPGGAAVASR
jgi:hypothetical protein